MKCNMKAMLCCSMKAMKCNMKCNSTPHNTNEICEVRYEGGAHENPKARACQVATETQAQGTSINNKIV